MTEGTSPGKKDLGSRPAGFILECAYEGNQVAGRAIEQAPAGRGEHRCPVAVAIIDAAGLHVALPAPHGVSGWVVPVALLAVLIAGEPGRP